MKLILKLEELGLFILGIYLFSQLDYAWWWFIVLIFIPDIGILGYTINNTTGALIYNLFHHRGIAVLIYLSGIYFAQDLLTLAGIILFSHASIDRVFGYGLKYPEAFSRTHLGIIGKSN